MVALDLPSAWTDKGPLAASLWPLAALYRGLLAARVLAWRFGWRRATRLPVPVVVVGNVVAGGAGKTPTVIALVRHLQARGWVPGVVSRGHGRRSVNTVQVLGKVADPQRYGDEPVLIARETAAPVAVGRDRPAAARALLQQHPSVDIVVSDDGMQHWALARDLTIVVFDERDVGNGWLLPAGPLRQPWPSAIHGTGPALVLRTAAPQRPPKAHPYPEFQAVRALAAQAINAHGQRQALSSWAADAVPLGALAGIARPHAFFAMLQERGLRLTRTLALPDHARGEMLLAALQQNSRSADAPRIWLCTDKDAVKLQGVALPAGIELWRVPLLLTPEPGWYAALDRQLQLLRAARYDASHGR